MKWYGLKIPKRTPLIFSAVVVGAFVLIFVVFNQKIIDHPAPEAATALTGENVKLTAPVDRLDLVLEPQYFMIIPFGVAWPEYGKGKAGLALELKLGAKVLAAAAGQVGEVSPDGKILTLDHGGNLKSVYENIKDVKVKVGDNVQSGEALGQAAYLLPDGQTTSFVYRFQQNGQDICPEPYLNDWTKDLFGRLLRQSLNGQGGRYSSLCQ